MNLNNRLLPVSFFVAIAATSTLAPVYASPEHSSAATHNRALPLGVTAAKTIAISPQAASSTSLGTTDTSYGATVLSGANAPSSGATGTPSPANSGTSENSKDSASDAYPRENRLSIFLTTKEIDSMPEEELRRRPLLYWRRWANKPPRVGLLSGLFFLITLTLTEFFKSEFAAARACCRRKFWRCFGLGLCLSTLMLGFARMLLMDMVGAPLAYLLIASLQLLTLAGLAVSSTLLAEAVLRRAKLADKLSRRPALYRVSLSVIGTIILGFVLAIPGVGAFPPIGIRLISLIGLLGAGGLLKTRFGRRPL